jgi:hypothetical protein
MSKSPSPITTTCNGAVVSALGHHSVRSALAQQHYAWVRIPFAALQPVWVFGCLAVWVPGYLGAWVSGCLDPPSWVRNHSTPICCSPWPIYDRHPAHHLDPKTCTTGQCMTCSVTRCRSIAIQQNVQQKVHVPIFACSSRTKSPNLLYHRSNER